MLDFIVFYEHRVRELENAVLLSLYLEKKGYTVEILHVDSWKMLYKRAKVVIMPYAYSDWDVFTFSFFPFCKINKMVNLQYEQIFTEKDERSDSFYPKDLAKKCQIISWGSHTSRSLRKRGVSDRDIHEVGQIAMDFNARRFRKAHLSRRQIAKEFQIPANSSWHLFISSFSYSNLHEAQVAALSNLIDDLDELIDLSIVSQNGVAEWFALYLKEHPDECVIYRPHPSEVLVDKIKSMEKEYPNFHVISDYSIRQWICVCDSISTWYSTSIADIYYAGKDCAILRPVSIPEEMELLMMRGASLIQSYSEFCDFMSGKNRTFPVSKGIMHEFFVNDFDGTCGERLADTCISVLNDGRCNVDFKGQLRFPLSKKILRFIWLCMMFFGEKINISGCLPPKYQSQAYYVYKESKGMKKEILRYRRRIDRVLSTPATDKF